MLTDKLNKPEEPVGCIFKTRFGEVKDNLQKNIKKVTGVWLGFIKGAYGKERSVSKQT
jgi:hypothetical protein